MCVFCVVSMSFIRGFWTGSFASVIARLFLIIVTLCTCVACIIACDCFPLLLSVHRYPNF